VEYCKTSDVCLQKLNQHAIQQCHKYCSICLVHDSLYYKNSLTFYDQNQLSENCTRSHPLSIWPVKSTINSYCFSLFANSPFLWNSIPYAVLQIRSRVYFTQPYAVIFSNIYLWAFYVYVKQHFWCMEELETTFKLFSLVCSLSSKDDGIQATTLLHMVRPETLEAYNMLSWADTGDKNKVSKILEKFEEHCVPRRNITWVGMHLRNFGNNR